MVPPHHELTWSVPAAPSAPPAAQVIAEVTAEAVYRDLAPQVLGYLRGQGAAEPEDLLGEVFVHVARDLHRVEGDAERVRRWVFTVARNRLVDDRRRRSARPRTSGDPVPDLPASAPVDHGIDPAMLAALRQLTDRQREVVVLRFVADLSLQDVARITRRPTGAVKALQHRALAQLRDRLADI